MREGQKGRLDSKRTSEKGHSGSPGRRDPAQRSAGAVKASYLLFPVRGWGRPRKPLASKSAVPGIAA